MKSYVEPLNAEQALEVLRQYKIPCVKAHLIGEGAVRVDGRSGTVFCTTPSELAAAIGGNSAHVLDAHRAFRVEAIKNYLEPSLENRDWIYDAGSYETIIPSLNEKGELLGVLSCFGKRADDFADLIAESKLPSSATLLMEYIGSPTAKEKLTEEKVVQRPPHDLTLPVEEADFQDTLEMALNIMEEGCVYDFLSTLDILFTVDGPMGFMLDEPMDCKLERHGWTLGNERSMTCALSKREHLQSLTRPLTASKTIEVLNMYGFSLDYSESREKFRGIEIQLDGKTKCVDTPMEVISALGEKAASVLEAHEAFRSRMLSEVINPCLQGSDSCPYGSGACYNVLSGETIHPVPPLYYFERFSSAVIPLQELLERSGSEHVLDARLALADKLSRDLARTALGKDFPASDLKPEGYSELTSSSYYASSVDCVLDKMEAEAIEQSPDGLPDFDASGWCIGDREHIIEACERFGLDVDFARLLEPEECLDDMAQAVESALDGVDEYEHESEHEEEILR